jgi:hypothetical protein
VPHGDAFRASKICFDFQREPSRSKSGVTAVQDLPNQKKAGKLSGSSWLRPNLWQTGK